MANESKFQTAAKDALFDAILSLEDRDECYRFFEDIMTIKELQDISQRWQVATLLSEGKTYSYIVSETGASAATISRVNKSLNYGNGSYKDILEKLAK
jgi:TrpR-related protein YerC/YecD